MIWYPGGFELFCNDCYRDYCDAENSKRFVYPTGGDVYVRLVRKESGQ